MKIFNLVEKTLNLENKEYVLGFQDTGSHACYMIYGILSPGEGGRLIKPGLGHEEIVFIACGEVKITGHFSAIVKEGQAFHIVGDSECFLENITDREVIYIIAGGHSEGAHH